VGEDVESGKIWEEYVDFVKGVSPGFIAVRLLNFENFVLVGETPVQQSDQTSWHVMSYKYHG
jgi:hypothetical protein